MSHSESSEEVKKATGSILRVIIIAIVVLFILDVIAFFIVAITSDLPISFSGFLGMNAGIKDYFLSKIIP